MLYLTWQSSWCADLSLQIAWTCCHENLAAPMWPRNASLRRAIEEWNFPARLQCANTRHCPQVPMSAAGTILCTNLGNINAGRDRRGSCACACVPRVNPIFPGLMQPCDPCTCYARCPHRYAMPSQWGRKVIDACSAHEVAATTYPAAPRIAATTAISTGKPVTFERSDDT